MSRLTRALSLMTLLVASAVPASANIIVNGDFETGDFTGWAQSGNVGSTFVNGDPFSGANAAWFGPNTDGFIAQTLATIPGHSYTISFWLKMSDFDSSGPPYTPNHFIFSWDGFSNSMTNFGAPFPYFNTTYTLPASAVSTQVKFGFSNVPDFWLLDDVSVVDSAVPEPSSVYLLVLGGSMAALALRRRRSA